MTKLKNYKCRRIKTDISYESIQEIDLSTIKTDDSCEADREEGYETVENIISKLGLSERHLAVLECRMNGMSYPQIAKVIQRATGTAYDYMKTIQRHYTAIYG